MEACRTYYYGYLTLTPITLKWYRITHSVVLPSISSGYMYNLVMISHIGPIVNSMRYVSSDSHNVNRYKDYKS